MPSAFSRPFSSQPVQMKVSLQDMSVNEDESLVHALTKSSHLETSDDNGNPIILKITNNVVNKLFKIAAKRISNKGSL